jgi:hypothetical protein
MAVVSALARMTHPEKTKVISRLYLPLVHNITVFDIKQARIISVKLL